LYHSSTLVRFSFAFRLGQGLRGCLGGNLLCPGPGAFTLCFLLGKALLVRSYRVGELLAGSSPRKHGVGD
jgi:hypothetical protein